MDEEVRKKIQLTLDNLKGELLDFNERESVVCAKEENFYSLLKELKENENFLFEFLIDLTCVDFLGTPEANNGRFEIVYHLYSQKLNHRMRVKVRLSGEEIQSITSLWTGANWLEREVYDLFGIKFIGHPNLERILLWEGFQGHPLRKDYALREEPPLPREE